MNGNLYDRMFAALEQMDEGRDPEEYLLEHFAFSTASINYYWKVLHTAWRVIEDFYANYF